MKTEINNMYFERNDENWKEFFISHGWVVIKNNISRSVAENGIVQWENLKSRYSEEMGLTKKDYEKEVSQWRNLWDSEKGVFQQLVYEPGLHDLAWESMGWKGSRLLHDHIICKPHKDQNEKIPWHQDSMFWPVNYPGVSSWTPFLDVSVNDGCLEVIDQSHLKGCESPVDFMAKERETFPDGSTRVLLPVSSGDTVLLHSLCWHRSSPNKGTHDRPVHIGLWIHSDSKWRPDLVDWHPINEHAECEPFERLEGKMFPDFGELVELQNQQTDIHGGTIRENEISMYDASKIVANQMKEISESDDSLTEILSSKSLVEKIVIRTMESGFSNNRKDLITALERLNVSFMAYEKHRARNVYNSAYSNWWQMAGEMWHRRLNPKVGIVGLGSVGNAAKLALQEVFQVSGYDINGQGSLEEVLESELIFVCVPTNELSNGKLDMSAINDVCHNLSSMDYNGLIIIKSTLQPGTMNHLTEIYPNLRISYVPEFLREKDAVEWFANPDRIIYSCEDLDEDELLISFKWVDSDVPRIKMTNLEAEIGKLAHNAYIATKVTFTCEIERISENFGCDANNVMKTVWTDRRVKNPSHLTPYLGGFGGKCVPKDSNALCSIDDDEESLIHMLHKRGHEDAIENRRI